MVKYIKNIALLSAFNLLATISVIAQAAEKPVEMASAMRSNGKIYVVVAVLTTILVGLFLFLISLEKRIRKMEKE